MRWCSIASYTVITASDSAIFNTKFGDSENIGFFGENTGKLGKTVLNFGSPLRGYWVNW